VNVNVMFFTCDIEYCCAVHTVDVCMMHLEKVINSKTFKPSNILSSQKYRGHVTFVISVFLMYKPIKMTLCIIVRK